MFTILLNSVVLLTVLPLSVLTALANKENHFSVITEGLETDPDPVS